MTVCAGHRRPSRDTGFHRFQPVVSVFRHEQSIARDLTDFVCDQLTDLDSRGERVKLVRLRVGAMSGVAPQTLKVAFQAAIIGTPLEGCGLELELVDMVIWCATCHQERLIDDITQLRCPVCRTRARQILQGKQLEISAIEVVDATTDSPGTPAHSQEQ